MSTWSINGTSEFPLTQPMVGQKEFYNVFKSFIGTVKDAGMATIFPVIGKWGIGKSRIGFEVKMCIRDRSGDGEALYEFIDHIPKFAEKILAIREQNFSETNEIKAFYGPIFKGYPQYRTILTRLQFIQLAEEIEDTEVERIGKTPNDI